jgi:hypothetical protein
MYKISLGVFCLVLAVILGNAMVVTGSNDAEEMCIPMGTILLEPLQGVEAKRTPGHDVAEAPKKSEAGTIDKDLAARYYKTAYHNLCIGCHREMQIQNKALEMSGRVLKENLPATGPTGCIQCHVKEE